MAQAETRGFILHPPQRSMDENTRYQFDYELWERSGGYVQATTNLDGLTASVKELNTLTGINTGETVQQQLDKKVDSSALGDMAFQTSSSVLITGGAVNNVSMSAPVISGGSLTGSTLTGNTYSGGNITSAVISNCTVTFPTGDAATNFPPCGKIFEDPTQTGSVGAAETDLISYAMPANILDQDGYFLEITACGSFAANANNKTIKLYIGTTVIYTTGAVAANSGDWEIKATILRTGSAAEKATATIVSSNATVGSSNTYTSVLENTATSLTIKITGQGTANNDVVQELMIIKLFN